MAFLNFKLKEEEASNERFDISNNSCFQLGTYVLKYAESGLQ